MKLPNIYYVVLSIVSIIGMLFGISLYPSGIGEWIFVRFGNFLILVLLYCIIEKSIYAIIKYVKK